MTKQEEIREKFVQFKMVDGRLNRKDAEWEAYKELNFLCGLGAVIKVERELPEIRDNKYIPYWGKWGRWFNRLWRQGQLNYKLRLTERAGYVAVVPLIGGE